MVGQAATGEPRAGLPRRGFVTALVAGALGGLATARAETLIENAPSSGTAVDATWGARAEEAPPAGARAPMDWRQLLLAGERSVMMSRGGSRAQLVRYRRADGSVDQDGYALACYMMRDVRANKMVAMDPSLLDTMCGIQRWLAHHGRDGTIVVTSGFRSRETNDSTEGAARNSMHLQGRAADVVIPGVDARVLGAMALEFNRMGGTGIYVGKRFIHIDTGAPRTWVRR